MEVKMSSILYKELLREIRNTILDSDLFKGRDTVYPVIKAHISGTAFEQSVKSIIDNNDYSCSAVFNLCKKAMEELAGGGSPENWLNYVYYYVLRKSFPSAVVADIDEKLDASCDFYLLVLRVISQYQKLSRDDTWQSKYPLIFLDSREEEELENPSEYRQFVKAFNEDFIYEMMKLNQEVFGYNTLDHICGVHYIALNMGRVLKKAGLPIDLGRVCGAAAGHDIGKYGCRLTELTRVPYLHYYYSDQWFRKHDITYIGHIAANHSTWDLELENLPLESLVLIYADFRVKNKKDEHGRQSMHIYNLKESFDVILDKLDNVDEAKEKRYRKVYAKLKDFEDYVLSLGVNTDTVREYEPGMSFEPVKKRHYALMHGNEVTDNIKYLAISHNINLMYQLRDESSLNIILEYARSESDWKKLREYIRVLEEYSTYLTQKQKLITLKFLYEQLIHPEDDIRRQCAELIGILIATFDEDYRKEVPQNVVLEEPEMTSAELLTRYVNQFISPDHKIIPLHRTWIGYSMSIMIGSLFVHCKKSQAQYFCRTLVNFYRDDLYKTDEVKLYLLETLKYVPYVGDEVSNRVLAEYILKMLAKRNNLLRLCSLEVINYLYATSNVSLFLHEKLTELYSKGVAYSEFPSENYLNLKIAVHIGIDDKQLNVFLEYCKKDNSKVSETFLSNLKTATNWVIKRTQVDFLLDYSLKNPEINGFYTAMHFCNLLKVSAVENVRNRAGEALIQIIPFLSFEQRNDVAVELLRALEINGYQFAEYIPSYLGRIIMYLHPIELDEIIDDFIDRIKESNPQLSSLILKTVSIAIVNYDKYRRTFKQDDKVYNKRLVKMLGIILKSMVSYNVLVKQVAFSVLGKEIFGSKSLDLGQKYNIFQLIAKKILTLLTDNKNEELLFLANSAGLNNIYRFISDYTFFNGKMELKNNAKVAFFPGAFDPFSLSHKGIVKAIRDLGFEVYLAVDEFSWSKRTLPNLLRKNIIIMSVADELNVYVYPEEYPTNIANPEDLYTLRRNFPLSNVHIVVGSDVVANASSYQGQRSENSIHTFPHILFERKNMLSSSSQERDAEEALKRIEGNIIKLALPPQYEDISSTQIRNYIDENRDISMLVDPLAQKYIYENGFYQREPQYKTLLQSSFIDIDVYEEIQADQLEELAASVQRHQPELLAKLKEFLNKPSWRLITVRNSSRENRIMGFAACHRIHSSLLYQEFRNSDITEFIRTNSVGKTVQIDGIFVSEENVIENLEQILLTEVLALCLAKDYDYAIFNCMIDGYDLSSLHEILVLQGFHQIACSSGPNPVLVVNMSNPSVLNLDIEAIIKEPFKSNKNIVSALARTRKKLQKAMNELYPGHLTLSFDRKMLYESLIRMICKENKVPIVTTVPRKLGKAMCVPYGDILNKAIVPNTVTKSLHTEKMFSPDMNSYTVGPYPYYLDLEVQLKMLKSFNRPIILIDDVLDKGYRIKVLDPLLKEADIQVEKIIVGILSGRGKELMEIQGRKVDSPYFIPKLRDWYNENAFYPFIGGDALWRGTFPQRNLLPSINLILPYTSPEFIAGASRKAIYNLSEVSIENSIDILETIENEFQAINERTLTLKHMGQVFSTPRCPEHGKNMDFDLNLSPSHYLKNDLELLKRLRNIII